jgi:hypothetical protein
MGNNPSPSPPPSETPIVLNQSLQNVINDCGPNSSNICIKKTLLLPNNATTCTASGCTTTGPLCRVGVAQPVPYVCSNQNLLPTDTFCNINSENQATYVATGATCGSGFAGCVFNTGCCGPPFGNPGQPDNLPTGNFLIGCSGSNTTICDTIGGLGATNSKVYPDPQFYTSPNTTNYIGKLISTNNPLGGSQWPQACYYNKDTITSNPDILEAFYNTLTTTGYEDIPTLNTLDNMMSSVCALTSTNCPTIPARDNTAPTTCSRFVSNDKYGDLCRQWYTKSPSAASNVVTNYCRNNINAPECLTINYQNDPLYKEIVSTLGDIGSSTPPACWFAPLFSLNQSTSYFNPYMVTQSIEEDIQTLQTNRTCTANEVCANINRFIAGGDIDFENNKVNSYISCTNDNNSNGTNTSRTGQRGGGVIGFVEGIPRNIWFIIGGVILFLIILIIIIIIISIKKKPKTK